MINTIFYYVETKEEYIQKVSNGGISSRTIVFIEDTGEIFKNGKMFSNYRLLVDSLDTLREDLLLQIENSKESLKSLIANLRNSVNETFDEELQQISENLQSYELLLARLREEFSTLLEDQGEAKSEINNLKGLIKDYVSWKSATTGTLTTLQSLLDALNGIISLQGSLVNTLRNSVINYESKVDLIEGTFQLYLEQYDITDKVKEIIGREISLKTGILHDFATRTDVENLFRTSIDEWFDSLSPSWNQLTSLALKGEDAYTAMAGFNSSIETIDGRITSLTNLFSSWNNSYSNFLSGLLTSANEAGSFFHLIANGDIGLSEVTASIFGEVNSDSSSITIKADKVFGLGSWIFDNATVKELVAGEAPNRIYINSSDGIKLERGTFLVNIDGSGQLAKGKISWDINGDITINGKIIGTGNINGLDSYWQDQIAVTIGDWGNGSLKSYIDSALDGKANVGELTTIRLRLTALEGNTYYDTDSLNTLLENAYGERIAEAESSITKLNSYFTKNGNIIGLKSEIDISSLILNYISNDSAISSLKTWALTVSGSTSAGFDLSAEIRNIANLVVKSASITANITDDLLSQILLKADIISLDGGTSTIGDFIRADGNHFLVWNFDVVNPPYYALRAYLQGKYPINNNLNLNDAIDCYNQILGGTKKYIKETFLDGTSVDYKYEVTPYDVYATKSAIMMDWGGMVFLKDYTDINDRRDTADHAISDSSLKDVINSLIPGRNSTSISNSHVIHRIPSTPVGSSSVSISALRGSGQLAWGKIVWCDNYVYETLNNKELIKGKVIELGGNAYYEPIVYNTSGGEYNAGDTPVGTPATEENGILVIEGAYLINPVIVGARFKDVANFTNDSSISVPTPQYI